MNQGDFYLGVGSIAYNTFHNWEVFVACLELVCRFKRRTFYIGSLRAKLILAPLGMPKCVWPSI